MPEITLHMQGVAPLVMKSDRGVDQLDPLVREIKKFTSKTKKTEDDHSEIARLEFQLGLYWNEADGPIMPTANVHKCLYEAAAMSKQGKKIQRGVSILEVHVPVLYEGPRDIDALYADEDHVYTVSVGLRGKRTMRTRPKFNEWGLTVPLFYDEQIFDLDDLEAIAVTAGQYIGLGERRPMFGRFNAVIKGGGKQNGRTAVAAERLTSAVA